MKKRIKISQEDVLSTMAEEIKEKSQRSTFKVLDWGEVMENEEKNLSDPQDFGKMRYALF